jgi:4'-phosphopantetheinyl transferase
MVLAVPLMASPRTSVTVTSIPPVCHAADLAMLSPMERVRAERLTNSTVRAEFVTMRAALRRLLAAETGIDAPRIAIRTDENGRPTLDGHDPDLDFNLTHSGALGAIAIARGGRVGIDIEWRGRMRGLGDIVADVMGPREAAMLASLDGDAFTRAFFTCWTRKEAIVKGLGVGIAYPLRTIDVPDIAMHGPVRVEVAPDSVWSVSTAEPAPGFTLSVAEEVRAPSPRDVAPTGRRER